MAIYQNVWLIDCCLPTCGGKNTTTVLTNIIIHAESPLVTTLEGSGPHYLKRYVVAYFKVFKGIPRDFTLRVFVLAVLVFRFSFGSEMFLFGNVFTCGRGPFDVQMQVLNSMKIFITAKRSDEFAFFGFNGL